MYCRSCGAQVQQGTKFCRRCGAPVGSDTGDFSITDATNKQSDRSSGKRRLAILMMLLLALLVGLGAALGVSTFLRGRELASIKKAMAKANGGEMPTIDYDEKGKVASIEGRFSSRSVKTPNDAVAVVGDIAPLLAISNPLKIAKEPITQSIQPKGQESLPDGGTRYVLTWDEVEIDVEVTETYEVSSLTIPSRVANNAPAPATNPIPDPNLNSNPKLEPQAKSHKYRVVSAIETHTNGKNTGGIAVQGSLSVTYDDEGKLQKRRLVTSGGDSDMSPHEAEFIYDDQGRLSQVDITYLNVDGNPTGWQASWTLSYAEDGRSMQAVCTNTSGADRYVYETYDDQGKLLVRQYKLNLVGGDGDYPRTERFSYNEKGQLVGIVSQNDESNDDYRHTLTIEYDDGGDLRQVIHTTEGHSMVMNEETYIYSDGLLVQKNWQGYVGGSRGEYTYSYDNDGVPTAMEQRSIHEESVSEYSYLFSADGETGYLVQNEDGSRRDMATYTNIECSDEVVPLLPTLETIEPVTGAWGSICDLWTGAVGINHLLADVWYANQRWLAIQG